MLYVVFVIIAILIFAAQILFQTTFGREFMASRRNKVLMLDDEEEISTPFSFTMLPMPHHNNYDDMLERMRGKVVSVGYNRDVSTQTLTNHRRKGEFMLSMMGQENPGEREDAECFVIDTHGASHTLMVNQRNLRIKGDILEDHARALAKALGVDFVSL